MVFTSHCRIDTVVTTLPTTEKLSKDAVCLCWSQCFHAAI